MVLLDETPWVVCVANTPAKQVAGIASMYDLRKVSSACCFLQKVDVVSLDARS
jgi:hypothetical protein